MLMKRVVPTMVPDARSTVATATVIADPLGLRTAVVNAYKRCVDALNKA